MSSFGPYYSYAVVALELVVLEALLAEDTGVFVRRASRQHRRRLDDSVPETVVSA